MVAGRGTPAAPGLALGLDHGGSCLGMAYRIAEDDIASELPILWAREMLLGGYAPRWLELVDANGGMFGHAITFVVDTEHAHYAGDLPSSVLVQRLATAAGSWGSSADYLFRTRDALREHAIADAGLEALSVLVSYAQTDLSLARAA